MPQVVCFDTAFHRTQPHLAQAFGLPRSLAEEGVQRYGFHGLSYEYLVSQLRELSPAHADGRVIIAHLGNGASLCALRHGRSIDTTMGLTPLDGLVMGTRSGTIDPGVLLYLQQHEKMSAEEIQHLLYHESGLLGVSGVSADPPALFALEDAAGETGENVRTALALYVRRIVREIGALAAVLGGLDLLVFTAGIGEHSAEIRARVCRDLAFLGLELDAAANAAQEATISTAASRVRVLVEPTNEEWVAATQALAVLEAPAPAPE
jgi:acetate kinase